MVGSQKENLEFYKLQEGGEIEGTVGVDCRQLLREEMRKGSQEGSGGAAVPRGVEKRQS